MASSRFFCRWPDASPRISRPRTTNPAPNISDLARGRASHRYTAAKANPEGTRMRRATCTRLLSLYDPTGICEKPGFRCWPEDRLANISGSRSNVLRGSVNSDTCRAISWVKSPIRRPLMSFLCLVGLAYSYGVLRWWSGFSCQSRAMVSSRPNSRSAALVSSSFCLEMPPSGATSTVSLSFSPLTAANLDRTAV